MVVAPAIEPVLVIPPLELLTPVRVDTPVTAKVPPMVELLVIAKPTPAAVEASWPEVVIASPAVVGVMVVPIRVK